VVYSHGAGASSSFIVVVAGFVSDGVVLTFVFFFARVVASADAVAARVVALARMDDALRLFASRACARVVVVVVVDASQSGA
jgi:hypothetical protein